MPNYKITSPDGKTYNITAPEGATADQALDYFKQNWSGQEEKAQPLADLKPDFSTSPMGRFLRGAQSAGEGGAQMVAQGISSFAPESEAGKYAQQYLDYGKQLHEQQAAKDRAANIGIDVAGMAGSMLNPLAAVSKNPVVAGALTAATQPAYEDDYIGEKVLQTVGGGALGGIFGKGLEKLGGYATKSQISPSKIEDVAAKQLQGVDIEPTAKAMLKETLLEGLRSGKKLDEQSLARMAEAKSLGIDLLKGQASRDPLLFSQEQNLRGASPAISAQLQNQREAIAQKIGGLSANAEDKYNAGKKLINALRQKDEESRKAIGNLYKEAEQSAESKFTIPLQGLAQDYANILNNFGDKIPSAVRKNFEDLGLLTGKQLKIFNPEEADKLEKVINFNYSNDPATNKALGQLKQSLRGAIESSLDEASPYAPAVKAAVARFKTLEEVPAIQSALKSTADADKFIKRNVIDASTDTFNKMLEGLDYNSRSQVKAQIGQHLMDKVYGINPAGDKQFSPTRLADELKKMGDKKLSAIYSPTELSDLKKLSKVMAYIGTEPGGSTVNRSNTAVSLYQNAGALDKVLGLTGPLWASVKHVGKSVNQGADVHQSLNPTFKTESIDLRPEELKALIKKLKTGSTVYGGVTGGQSTED